MIPMRLVAFGLLAVAWCFTGAGAERVVACHTHIVEMTCEAGRRIMLKHVRMGVGVGTKCGEGKMYPLGGRCSFPSAGYEVFQMCANKPSCKFPVNGSVFENNYCRESTRILMIDYDCVTRYSDKGVVACHNDTVEMTCEAGRRMKLKQVWMDVGVGTRCGEGKMYPYGERCFFPFVQYVVDAMCANKASCKFPVDESVFGNQYCRESTRILMVDYDCVTPVPEKRVLACHNDTVEMTCEAGTKIQLKYVSMSVGVETRCRKGKMLPIGRACSFPFVQDVVDAMCTNRVSCKFPVDESVFGYQDCKEKTRSLEVQYECVKLAME